MRAVRSFGEFVDGLRDGGQWFRFDADIQWEESIDLAEYIPEDKGTRFVLRGGGEYADSTLWRRCEGPMLYCSDTRHWELDFRYIGMDGRFAPDDAQPALRFPAIQLSTWDEVSFHRMPGEKVCELGGTMFGAVQFRRVSALNCAGHMHLRDASDFQWYGGNIERAESEVGLVVDGSAEASYGPVIFEGVHAEANRIRFTDVRKLQIRAPTCWRSNIQLTRCHGSWYDGMGWFKDCRLIGYRPQNRIINYLSGRW